MNKTAFGHAEAPAGPKKSFGEQMSTVAKHPGDFLKSVVKGELTGIGAGAVGGAIVAAPLAGYWAMKKHPERIFAEAKKGTPFLKRMVHNIHPSSNSYAGRLVSHLGELGKGETVGGGVLGLGMGANKFFKRHSNEKSGVEKKAEYIDPYQQMQYDQSQMQMQPQSSGGGKKLLAGAAALAGGIMFRKQIGGAIKKAFTKAPATVAAATPKVEKVVAEPIMWNKSMSAARKSKITGERFGTNPISSGTKTSVDSLNPIDRAKLRGYKFGPK